ncbi:hypothetical protein J2W42_004325 [Rhizobium tibeticum]|nr:hypothetical protein [Rhizobium tibeticum]
MLITASKFKHRENSVSRALETIAQDIISAHSRF